MPMGMAIRSIEAEREDVDGERDREAFEDLVLDLASVGKGLAEIEGHEFLEPRGVLFVKRLVGAVKLSQPLPRFGGGLGREFHLRFGGTARSKTHDPEAQYGDAEEDGDHQERPFYDIGEHGLSIYPVTL